MSASASHANRAPDPQPPLTPKQLRAIRAGVTALGWDDAEYRSELARYRVRTGGPRLGQPIESTKELSRAQARRVLSGMAVLGFSVGGAYGGHRPQSGSGATTLATPAQLALIERLRAEIRWWSPLGYQSWIGSSTSPTKGRPVRTYQQAEAVIEGLKSLRRHADAGAS